jgi:hypothetical protein
VKKLALAGLAGLLLVGGLAASAPLAYAADATPCSTALLAQADLDAQVKAADVADKAAADAKVADDAAADAAAAVDVARAAAVNAGLSSAQLTSAGLKALRDERAAIVAVPAADRTLAQVDRLIVLERQIPLAESFLAAEIKAATAKALADKSDADALRREADKTDADALRVKLAAAVKAATDACKGADGVFFANCDQVRAAGKAPLARTEPGYRTGLDSDSDGIACEVNEDVAAQVVVIPRAIDTGEA